MSVCQYLVIMGNESNNKNNIANKKNSSLNVKKNITKINSSKNEYQTDAEENNEFQTKKQPRFATVFQWDGGGTNVYLTGSFCDWHQFFEMEKYKDPENENNNKFFLTLFLPKGAYQYKFKIDDQWKCNSNFPTCSDKNGNINNIIDLTKQKREDGTTDFSTSYVTTKGAEQKMDETKISNFSDNFFSDDKLSIIKSSINEISENSSVDYSYKNNVNMNNIEKNESLEEEEKLILNNNYSYKRLLPIPIEHLDHLILNKTTFNRFSNHKNLISSCSFRYGFKTTTVIYYKPKLKRMENV